MHRPHWVDPLPALPRSVPAIPGSLRDDALPRCAHPPPPRSSSRPPASRGLLGATQARKLIAVVDAFTRDQVLALGLEKSFAVLAYAAATPEHEVPQLLVAMGIEGKPLAELSAKEIQRRTIRVRARAGAKRALSPAEKSARLAAAGWQAALRKAGLRDAVTAVRHVDGHLILEVRAPFEQVERSLAKRR